MNDRILDESGKPVKAMCQFEYKGYCLEYNKISNCPVAVFEGENGRQVHDADTIEDALNWVNGQW